MSCWQSERDVQRGQDGLGLAELVGRLADHAVGGLGGRDGLRDEVHVLLPLGRQAAQLVEHLLAARVAGRELLELLQLAGQHLLRGVEGGR